jgi:hypothetical protein
VVWGLASLVHSGFHAEHVFEPHDRLLGFHYTPLMGAIEVGFGLVMLLAGALLRLGRGRMRTIDSLAVGFGSTMVTLASGAALALGLTVLAGGWTDELRHWLGIGRPEAWVAVTIGTVGVLLALASPIVLAAAARPPETTQPMTATLTELPVTEPAAVVDATEPPASEPPESPPRVDEEHAVGADSQQSDPARSETERREFTVG